MSSEYLSQDEVDALLRGVNGGGETPEPEAPADGVRPYDIATQERIVRGRMPTLELINERFARQVRIALFNFMRKSPEIAVGQVRVIKYAEFIRNLVVPTNLNIMALQPLRGNGLIVIEPNLIFGIVDNLFGGDGRFHTRVEGRDFTATEQRIILRLLEVVNDEYRKAWAPVYPLAPEYVRSEMHTQFASIATPTEIVVETTFTIEMGAVTGKMHVCFPYASVEPLRDLLFSSIQADRAEPDKRWAKMLAREVQDADVELTVNLAHADLKVRDLVALKPGDVVPVEIPESVVATIDNVPMFGGRYGTLNGQYAIRVERILAGPRDELAQGAPNVQ